MLSHRAYCGGVLGLALAVGGWPLWAADSDSTTADATAATGSEADTIPLPQTQDWEQDLPAAPTALEALTVSAQRRVESIQDVPVMVSAFEAEALAQRGINTVLDLQFVVPGMVYTASGPYTFPYLRGVGSNSFVPAVDSSIATLLDGVYSASIMTSFRNFADIERIEVLKGPQGTLFGRNTTAGVISITTRLPQREFGSKGAIYAGSDNRFGGSAFVTGPVGERLALSASAYTERFGHYYRNVNPDAEQPIVSENWGLRLKGMTDIGDKGSLVIQAFETRESGNTIWENIQPSREVLALGGQPVEQRHRTNANWLGLANTRVLGTDAKLEWSFPGIDFWSLTAYQDTVFTGGADLDGSNADVAYVDVPDLQFARALSQEFQLASVGRQRWDWLIGAYGSLGKGGWSPIDLVLGPHTTLQTEVLGPLRQTLGEAVPTDLPDIALLEIFGIIDNTAYAGFGEVSYRPLEAWAITAGLRYSYEERILERGSTSAYVLGLPDEPIAVRDFRNLPADWDNWSPKLGLEWQRGLLLSWLTYSEGFKSGTWNPLPLLEPVSLVQPERIRSWEVGVKSDLWDGRLRLNASAYQYDYQDLQVFVVSIKSNGTAKVENAGRARVRGLELDLQLRPAPRWNLSAAAAYTQGRYLDFLGTGYDESGEPFQGDFAGNRMMYAPTTTVNLELERRLPLAWGELSAALNYYHASDFYFDAQNDFLHPAYGLVGGRLSWAMGRRDMQLSLVGTNLTDADYKTLGVLFDFGRVVTDGPGRQWFLRLDWGFD